MMKMFMQSELRLYYAASIVWPEALMFLVPV